MRSGSAGHSIKHLPCHPRQARARRATRPFRPTDGAWNRSAAGGVDSGEGRDRVTPGPRRSGRTGADVFRRPNSGTSGRVAHDVPDPSSHHLIDLRAVVKDYTTDAGPFRALDGIDLQVDRGEFISVVGRSGCGKSTLMNMITGIDRATAGVSRSPARIWRSCRKARPPNGGAGRSASSSSSSSSCPR